MARVRRRPLVSAMTPDRDKSPSALAWPDPPPLGDASLPLPGDSLATGARDAVRAVVPRLDRGVVGRRFVGPWSTPVAVAGDFLAVSMAAVVAGMLPSFHGSGPGSALVIHLLISGVALGYLAGRHRYRWHAAARTVEQVIAGTAAAAMATTVGMVVSVLQGGAASEQQLATFFVAAALLLAVMIVTRDIARTLLRRLGLVRQPALIVGAGLIGAHIAQRLVDHRAYGLTPVGFIDSDPLRHVGQGPDLPPVLGRPADLPEIVERTGAVHVVMAFSSEPDRSLIPMVRACQRLGLQVSVVPRFFDALNERVVLEHFGGMPITAIYPVDVRGWQFRLKHSTDRLVSAVLLILLSPLLVAIAAAVKLESPGPVIFRQRRVGRDGLLFDLLKFRTMTEPSEPGARFDPDRGSAPGGVEGSDRRTRLGAWLRRFSLDELPQLINVLRGEMSLIGPRPERPAYVDLFLADIERYGERHRVKSGITGWAQVHGLRGQTSIVERVEWDNFYIENWSLALDLKIALMTLLVPFRNRSESRRLDHRAAGASQG